jgi:ribosomal protein S18 acetylase RimI-like enzyme
VIVRELQSHEAQFYDRMKPPGEIGHWYIERLKSDIARHRGAFLVAQAGDAVVGYATLLTEVSSEAEPDEILFTFAHVADLAVLNANRGQGYGRALLSECERIARQAGQKWLRLSVLANNVGARRFYRGFGLEEKFLTLEKPLT